VVDDLEDPSAPPGEAVVASIAVRLEDPEFSE
jgi:hypothetical protein